jgi:uncharacterized glyoxalase superfamily protein PhnB
MQIASEKGVFMSQLKAVSPIFAVDNVVSSAEYYRDKLGFSVFVLSETVPFASVERDAVSIHLLQATTEGARNSVAQVAGHSCDLYIRITNADELFAEMKFRGAQIHQDIGDQPYEMRDFSVQDCNGYILTFGHPLF